MRKWTSILMFIIVCANNLHSQTITGRVIDDSLDEALPYVNIVVLNVSDSTFIVGTVTEEDGRFSLNVQHENYLVRFSSLGYETQVSKISSSDLGVIRLSPSTNNLSEVTITAPDKIFRMENGGISANIQNSLLREMGSLPDVLGQLPFVMRNEDSYTVFGKGSPIFYINNRLVRNQSELQQISSKDIKKVTVITNPGAEYDASVNAVIKIETIRPVGDGISGQVFSFNKY